MILETRQRRFMAEINIIPLVDVVLVLLVIFMVTAPMTNPGVVELPKVGQALKQVAAPLVVTLKPGRILLLDGRRMEHDELLYEVRQKITQQPEQSVVIAADKSVRYEDLVWVMDMLKQGQVDKVGLLLNPTL